MRFGNDGGLWNLIEADHPPGPPRYVPFVKVFLRIPRNTQMCGDDLLRSSYNALSDTQKFQQQNPTYLIIEYRSDFCNIVVISRAIVYFYSHSHHGTRNSMEGVHHDPSPKQTLHSHPQHPRQIHICALASATLCRQRRARCSALVLHFLHPSENGA
jgi:hypothetical protein